MNDPELPPDLAALERRLAARPRAVPSPEFEPRVLAACRGVERAPARREWGIWNWAAVAAGLLLAINLSMSVAADTDWHLTTSFAPENRVARLQELSPDLPEPELRRQALLARGGAGLAPSAVLAPDTDHLRALKESDRWDER